MLLDTAMIGETGLAALIVTADIPDSENTTRTRSSRDSVDITRAIRIGCV